MRPRAPERSHGCCSIALTAMSFGARSASRRTSSRRPGRRWSTRSSSGCKARAVTLPASPPPMSLTEPGTIPLAQPVIGRAEEELVLEVLRSGRLSLGPRLAEFEQAFAERVGAGHASAVSSGTAGLHLALRAVGVTEGAEVITSPFSFVA